MLKNHNLRAIKDGYRIAHSGNRAKGLGVFQTKLKCYKFCTKREATKHFGQKMILKFKLPKF
jgi:hypothetical protein